MYLVAYRIGLLIKLYFHNSQSLILDGLFKYFNTEQNRGCTYMVIEYNKIADLYSLQYEYYPIL
jgi:hypothetical protein